MRVASYSIEGVMSLASLGLLIYYLALGDPQHRMLPTIGSVLIFLVPVVVELLFKVRFSLFIHLLFTLSMTFAVFCGCALNMHGLVGPFDEISHFAFGYISCLFIFYALSGMHDFKSKNSYLVALSIFLFSMSFASLWEIFEFLTDGLLGTSGIGGVSSEALNSGMALGLSGPALNFYAIEHSTYIWDSITDMCLHLAGSVLFTLQFALHKIIKTPLMLAYVERDHQNNVKRYYHVDKVALLDNDLSTKTC